MKVEIKESSVEDLSFPKLMISEDENKYLVLFFEKDKGILLLDKGFEYAEYWNNIQFKDFKGTMTITQ